MALHDNLKRIREEHKITKRELCEKTGISERAYLTYEFGEREPKIGVITKLADFYGVTTDYLLGREQKKASVPNLFEKLNLFKESNLGEDDEKEVVAKYMSLPPEIRVVMLELLLRLANLTQNEDTKSESNPIQKTESPLVYCGTVGEELERREQAEQKLSESLTVQSSPQIPAQQSVSNEPSQVETEQPKMWRMAARSTDGKYVSRVMTPEEVELIESLEDVPKSRY